MVLCSRAKFFCSGLISSGPKFFYLVIMYLIFIVVVVDFIVVFVSNWSLGIFRVVVTMVSGVLGIVFIVVVGVWFVNTPNAGGSVNVVEVVGGGGNGSVVELV